MRRISNELYQAIADAQQAAQKAHNLAYREHAPMLLSMALGRAQSILISWQARLARGRDPFASLKQAVSEQPPAEEPFELPDKRDRV